MGQNHSTGAAAPSLGGVRGAAFAAAAPSLVLVCGGTFAAAAPSLVLVCGRIFAAAAPSLALVRGGAFAAAVPSLVPLCGGTFAAAAPSPVPPLVRAGTFAHSCPRLGEPGGDRPMRSANARRSPKPGPVSLRLHIRNPSSVKIFIKS